MVQHAELKLIILRKCELCHRELAFVAMAQDAHILVQHDALLLVPVWLEEIIKLGIGVAAVEARGKQSQGRRRRG